MLTEIRVRRGVFGIVASGLQVRMAGMVSRNVTLRCRLVFYEKKTLASQNK